MEKNLTNVKMFQKLLLKFEYCVFHLSAAF